MFTFNQSDNLKTEIRKIIEKKYLMCNQKLPGGSKCQKIFQYHHYRSHEKAGCTDIPIQADCCGQEFTRIEKKKHDLCASKQREVFEQRMKKEAEEAEKKHALAIAQYESDIDEFEKEIDRCQAEIKRYQMDISKKDRLIATVHSKLDKLDKDLTPPAPLPAEQSTNDTNKTVPEVKVSGKNPTDSFSPVNTDYGLFSDEDRPAKKRKTDILDAQKSDKKKSINVSTAVPIESTPTVDNNNLNSTKTNLISIKKEPCFESLPRPIKREPNDSVLYFEELISRVSERREANKQKIKKRVSFSSKPLSVRLIPPNPPRPALAPEVYVAPPAAPVSKKRKATSTRKRKATDEKYKATKSNIARKSPIVARRSNRIRAQKTVEKLQTSNNLFNNVRL